MTSYSDLIDRFLERSGVPPEDREMVADLAWSVASDVQDLTIAAMKAETNEAIAATVMLTGLMLTHIGTDNCLEAWGLQPMSENSIIDQDLRDRLARYILITNFKNIGKRLEAKGEK